MYTIQYGPVLDVESVESTVIPNELVTITITIVLRSYYSHSPGLLVLLGQGGHRCRGLNQWLLEGPSGLIMKRRK